MHIRSGSQLLSRIFVDLIYVWASNSKRARIISIQGHSTSLDTDDDSWHETLCQMRDVKIYFNMLKYKEHLTEK